MKPKRLQCDMRSWCRLPVTHLDDKGFIYCQTHGVQRRESGYRCRTLTTAELAQLQRGEQLTAY